MSTRSRIFEAAFCGRACGAEAAGFCQPSTKVPTEFQKAAEVASSVTDPFGALAKAAPFRELRDRYPDNLFAHEGYQDAIHDHGIEGHLRLLEKQYQELENKHPAELMYRYLSLRAVVGRSTVEVIQRLNELIADHPDFAPAHRTLAEIYSTASFRDSEKENSEKAKFLALCPGGNFTRRPPPVPGPSTLIDQAEQMLADNGDSDRILALTTQGLREFVWRSQRIRAFDWYSRDEKLQSISAIKAKYWQAWPILKCVLSAKRDGQWKRTGFWHLWKSVQLSCVIAWLVVLEDP